ncbi:MAG: helix-hairpin-helix domain-containing protein [Ktedonobacteraceae bacterium]
MNIMQLTQTIHLLPSTSFGYKRATDQLLLPGIEAEEAPRQQITNRQIAEALSAVADLLDRQNSNPYRVQAYRNAARGVLDLAEPAAQIVERGERLPVAGLGARLQIRIAALVRTGDLTFYDDLHIQALPVGVRKLMAVEFVGPRTAIRLYDELNIDTPEKLWWAAHQQRIRQLPGFGTRSEARLKEAASRLLKHGTADELSGAA